MKAQAQRRLRQTHSSLGLFFAPAIFFFALSGSLQALGFQDRAAGYQPPAWINLVANVHKHGVIRRAERAREQAQKPAKAASPKTMSAKTSNPFSVFAALLGLLLAAATGLGIWIALLNRRGRRTSILLLLAGLSVPILLLAV